MKDIDHLIPNSVTEVEHMMVRLNCDEKYLNAKSILEVIVAVEFKTIQSLGKRFMFCFIKMDNGYVVVGDPAAVISESNWRDEIGQKVAFENTFDKLYGLEAYRYLSEKKKDNEYRYLANKGSLCPERREMGSHYSENIDDSRKPVNLDFGSDGNIDED